MFSARHLGVLVLACSLGALSAQPTQTVTQIVVASPSHTTLETLVIAASLDATLGGTGPFTLFAPTDAAFTAISGTTLYSKLSSGFARWKPLLKDTLLYHTVPKNVSSSGLPSTATLEDSLAGKSGARWKLSLVNVAPQVTATDVSNGVSTANGAATVTSADNYATNGVVHVIDTVVRPPSTQRTVVGIAQGSSAFSTLVNLITAANLNTTLSLDDLYTSFTVFAPTNDAFNKIDSATLTCLQQPANVDTLASVLKLHVLNNTVMSDGLPNPGTVLTTLASGRKNQITYSAANRLSTSSGTADITGTGTDNLANNGVVHVLDTVLLPSLFTCPATIVNVVGDSTAHATLETLLTQAGLVSTLQGAGPFTLFAPTDDAFTALGTSTLVSKLTGGSSLWKPLLQDVLKYHVVSGKTLSSDLPAAATATNTTGAMWQLSLKSAPPQVSNVNGAGGPATVTTADLQRSNGVVHVVDKVLLPPSTQRTVVGIAQGSSAFSTLVSLLGAASLVTTLSTDDVNTAFTVFAPTNEAFNKLDSKTLTCLQDKANVNVLANLLKYHVVSGTVMSSDLTDGQTISTIATSGVKTFTYTATGKTLKAKSDVKITNADNLASNGVVHHVDTILVPSDFACLSSGAPAAKASLATLLLGLVASALALVF